MADFPYKRWSWRCGCGERWPKRTLQNLIFDPVEQLTCLADCKETYDPAKHEETVTGDEYVRWLWKCGGCAGLVSWADDFCHNPACGQAWLVERPRVRQGGKPTYYPPKYEKPTPEEEAEARRKIAEKKKHKPIPGCPEVCGLPHEFTLRLVADRDQGCARATTTVHAELLPAIDPNKTGTKGRLDWTLEAGAELVRFAGGAATASGTGVDTQVTLHPQVDDGYTKFPAGTVELACAWNFGGPADTTQRATLRLPFHAGTTATCPADCPAPKLDGVDVRVVGVDGLPRDLEALCPDEPVVLELALDPPVAADVTWTLLDAAGEPVAGSPGGRGFEGAGLLGPGPVLEGRTDAQVRLLPGRGRWVRPAPPTTVGAAATTTTDAVEYELDGARVRVEVRAGGKSVQRTVALDWHAVELAVEASWHGTQQVKLGGALVTKRSPAPLRVRYLTAGQAGHDDGAYAGYDDAFVNLGLPGASGLARECGFVAKVGRVEATAHDCARAGGCLDDRWGVGFVQAHRPGGRWWKFERVSGPEHRPRWLMAHTTYGGAKLLRDALEDTTPRPWYGDPFRIGPAAGGDPTARSYTGAALDDLWESDCPFDYNVWERVHTGATYALRHLSQDDAFAVSLAVGRHDPERGRWSELVPLATHRWRAQVAADVARPADGARLVQVATAPTQTSDVDVDPNALFGLPRPNTAAKASDHLSDVEPTGDPSFADLAVRAVRLEHGDVGSRSCTVDDPGAGEPIWFAFAPGWDTVDVAFELENPEGRDLVAQLELHRVDDPAPWPLWTRRLTDAELAAGRLAWKGELEPAPAPFPGGLPTLAGSPYELRLVLPDVEGPRRVAWTRFAVEAASIELDLGPKKALTDERVYGQLVSKGIPPAGGAITLALAGSAFALTGEDKLGDVIAEAYRKRWGDGPAVPLLARVRLKSLRDGAVLVPRAVGAVPVLFEAVDDPAPLGGLEAHAGALIEAARTASLPGVPEGANAPAAAGGKRGGAPVLALTPGYPARSPLRDGEFPFKAVAAKRPGAVVVTAWHEGTLEGCAGVLLRPSALTGDGYRVRAAVVADPAVRAALDRPGAWSPPAGAATGETGAIRVARQVKLHRYLRKRSTVTKADLAVYKVRHNGAFVVAGPDEAASYLAAGWNPAIAAALEVVAEETWWARYAVDPALDQHAAGDAGLVVRTWEQFQAALPALNFGFTSPTKSEWPDKVGDVAQAALSELVRPLLDGPGLVVLHTGLLSSEGSSLDGVFLPWQAGKDRDRQAVFLFDKKNPRKPPADDWETGTLVHEGGHALGLPHDTSFDAPYSTPGNAAASLHRADPGGPKCTMGYGWNDIALCGLCRLRLAGWNSKGPWLPA